MKNFIYILLLCSSLTLVSQELNQDFLESLPKNIQQDVLNRIDDDKSTEEPLYRSIDSQTELEKITLESLKKGLDKDFKAYQDLVNANSNIDQSTLFGSDFFRTYQSTFFPINEPNLSPSYQLDFGDSIEIQLIGQIDEIDVYTIKRDGTINLPDIGPVNLLGLSLSDASSLIKAKVKSSYIGTEAFISLKKVRDINILVSGNAYNPGIYTVSGNSNILHVLAISGGINKYGSYREINLIRDQKVIESFDMYDLLITGKYNPSIPLRSGDTIFVEPVKKIVTTYGGVKIPAKYELNEEQNLIDVINYANGITMDADLNNIYLERILDGTIESLPIRSIKQFERIKAADGDAVYIRKHNFKTVSINGAVLKPGKYLMSDGETLDDLIKKSGGLIENAYPFGAVYETTRALTVNKMAKEKLYNEFIDNIITVSQKNPSGFYDLSGIIDLTSNLETSNSNGRVVIDLNNELEIKRHFLNDGDSLTIPERPNHIYIYGEVNFEGALRFVNNEGIDFYIQKSGGFKEQANKKMIYVLHPNGDTQRYSSGRKNIFQSSPSEVEFKLYPGSVVFVPRAIDDTASNRLATQAYVSILGNIGIALASLSSINNN